MASLDPGLAQLLQNVVVADGGANHRFAPMFIPTNPAPIAVAPYVADPHLLLTEPVRALEELGYLEVDPPEKAGGYGPFRLTPAGREAAQRAAQEAAEGQRSAEQQTVARLTDALDRAIRQTTDPAQQAALQAVRDAAEGADATLLAGAIVAAAKG